MILDAITGAADADALEAVRIQYLSRSGALPVLLEKMGAVPKEKRPAVGKAANEAKQSIQAAFDSRKSELTAAAESEDFDPTLPGRYDAPGLLHPVLQAGATAISLLARLRAGRGARHRVRGLQFRRARHAARSSGAQRAGHVCSRKRGLAPSVGLDGKSPAGRRLLRTQTLGLSRSSFARCLAQAAVSIIAPGRCYRRDEIDATHGMSFFQMEGLVVGERVTLADLKGTLE